MKVGAVCHRIDSSRRLAKAPIIPPEGWHVLHLFYKIEHGQWQLFTESEKIRAKTRLAELVQEIRSAPDTQLLSFAMVTPKADMGFMLVTPDLQAANAWEKQISLALGADVMSAASAFFSMTERSEYLATEKEYKEGLQKDGIAEGSPEWETRMKEIQERLDKYLKFRLYPTLPDWPVVCFYPMMKRRKPEQNWYGLPFEKRKELMAGHGRVGRKWHGKILQLITGCTGLDDAEWGVTLFAQNTYDVKGIVYEMRFDPVSADYAEFGEFYIGLQLPLDQLYRRLQL
jgi:hydrogen peroxide-dependent heme synthase